MSISISRVGDLSLPEPQVQIQDSKRSTKELVEHGDKGVDVLPLSLWTKIPSSTPNFPYDPCVLTGYSQLTVGTIDLRIMIRSRSEST